MADVYATVADLKGIWPDMPVGADEHAEVMLRFASALMRAECPMLMEVEADVRTLVCCEVVKAAMYVREGSGVSSVMNVAGPFTQQVAYRADTDDLYLTKKHKRLLGCGRQRAFSVDLLAVPDVP